MPRLCQRVLFLVASAAIAGCYDMHGFVDHDAAVRDDAGRWLTPADVGPPRDDAWYAPEPDASLACPPARPVASCLESYVIPAGLPVTLPFELAGCGCCVATGCDVRVDEASRRVQLTTTACSDTCICDACNPIEGSCALPPLHTLGPWIVEANGTIAFSIGVAEISDPTFVPPPPGCATYAAVDPCGGTPDLTTGPAHGAVCRGQSRDGVGREVLRLVDPCGGCGTLDSVCEVIVSPRRTDDLPPGGNIELLARTYGTSCDVDCPGVCVRRERDCELPPLRVGDYYRVLVDGVAVLDFVEGEPFGPCDAP